MVLVYIIDSEDAYLNLIADLSNYGVHCPNPFGKPDRYGLSISDSFNKLTPEIAEEYLGVRDYDHEVKTIIDENGTEWEEEQFCGDGPLNRESLHICPELAKQIDIPPPTEEDYPILIMWDWADDFDRFGNVKTRFFSWVSLRKIKRIKSGTRTPVLKTHRLWTTRYAEKFKAICQDIEKRNREKYESNIK